MKARELINVHRLTQKQTAKRVNKSLYWVRKATKAKPKN
jgi:hypothetical protein